MSFKAHNIIGNLFLNQFPFVKTRIDHELKKLITHLINWLSKYMHTYTSIQQYQPISKKSSSCVDYKTVI